MDETTTPAASEHYVPRAFEFTGRWQDFAPIAFTNLLLTIVTLGIYRFWAKARERQYFWSQTRFIDDHLEWTGTGKEMFLGFLMVVVAALPIFALFFFAIRLITEGNDLGKAVGAALFLLLYGFFFYITGVASFRALRYRLSRTYWHGIRGGSNDGGWNYGWQYVWRMLAGFFALGLLVPWAMTSLWNHRFNKMSFGPHRFVAEASAGGLMVRWLLIYALVIGTFAVAFLVMWSAGDARLTLDGGFGAGLVFVAVAFFVVFYIALPLAMLAYFAAYYRQVAQATSIAGLEFRFTARTKDWLILFLGHIGLVIITLGVAALFISYRNYSFAVRHLEATGVVDLAALTQSSTRSPGDAEGLADAFDIGAI